MTSIGAILLAGGRGSRVGGAVKPLFVVGGRTLLHAAVDAARDAGADPITVAAPVLDPTLPVTWAPEDPPFGGPVAGIIAGLDSWRDSWDDSAPGAPAAAVPEWTLVLACDLPDVGAAVSRLVHDMMLLPSDIGGVCLADATGRAQWLTGLYRTAALRETASTLPDRGRNASMRALVAGLNVAVVDAPDATRDIDTWEDLKRAKERMDG
ncbi:MAG: NTP transferase domain-containing protein [Microbacterium sp.]|uniref:molybdenum cofactor guanylyltransferase n=1 Tax=Microbacterium sp. TaxID=51671 RepID=UPI0039E6621A